MKVRSLNIGRRQRLEVRGSQVDTGIFKRPATGPRQLTADGFEGDVLVERRKAGRQPHAVYLFPHEHYAYWQARLEEAPFDYGHFGENLTTIGLVETQIRVGDVLRCGTARLQVTLPRIPCRKLNAKMGFSFARMFLESRRVGFYLRVLEPGVVQAGDSIELISSDPDSPTMDELIRVSEFDYWDVDALEALLLARDLPPLWQERIRDKLERAQEADGWFGLRALSVVRRDEEAPGVVSLYLRCTQGRELPPFSAGQYLTLAARPSSGQVARRSYAISSASDELSTYRITVRQKSAPDRALPDGVVSTYLYENIAVGDELRVAAPRGSFTLDVRLARTEELTFVVQGIGIAPVISMLHRWARSGGRKATHLFYECKANPVLLTEAHEIAERHPLTVHLTPDSLSAEHVLGLEEGRTTRHYFIAGTSGFVDSLRTGLLALGIDESRIRQERFGRRS